MLETVIIVASSKEEMVKQFENWVNKNPKVNILLPSINTHIVQTFKGMSFYLWFIFTKQSNLMMGQHGIT